MIPRPPAIHGPRDLPVVDFTPPTTIFFVHRLKSNLGEALMPVLSSFLCVPRVSALVSSATAAAKLLPAADCPCGSLASRRRARRLRPAALTAALPCPAAGCPCRRRAARGKEGGAGHGDKGGDVRERDDVWAPCSSVCVYEELNEWIARLLEGTTK